MDRDLLQQRIESYKFFSYFFFATPDADLVEKVLAFNLTGEQIDEGSALLMKFIAQCKEGEKEQIVQDLKVDRTRLFHGLSEHGARPPYESLYLKLTPNKVIGDLNRVYAAEGMTVDSSFHQSSDYIGVEINFLQFLCEKELGALDDNDLEQRVLWSKKQAEFFNNHLGLWAGGLTEEMLKFAQTDFYRAIALMLRDFMSGEAENFC